MPVARNDGACFCQYVKLALFYTEIFSILYHRDNVDHLFYTYSKLPIIREQTICFAAYPQSPNWS